MNKYQESLDFIKGQLKLKYKVKEIHIAEIVAESFRDLQELIDKYEKLENALDKACEELANTSKQNIPASSWKDLYLHNEGERWV